MVCGKPVWHEADEPGSARAAAGVTAGKAGQKTLGMERPGAAVVTRRLFAQAPHRKPSLYCEPGMAHGRRQPVGFCYFFSPVPLAPGGFGNGNVLNIDFAWLCICSCICTNMFFDCSI